MLGEARDWGRSADRPAHLTSEAARSRPPPAPAFLSRLAFDGGGYNPRGELKWRAGRP
jgi:hypothetical protein